MPDDFGGFDDEYGVPDWEPDWERWERDRLADDQGEKETEDDA